MKNDREVMQALLDNETLSTIGGVDWYLDANGFIVQPEAFLKFPNFDNVQIKQKTININGFEVPEPVRKLSIDDIYYIVGFTTGIMKCEFKNTDIDLKFINSGICHSTLGAAKIHCAALLSFTKDK